MMTLADRVKERHRKEIDRMDARAVKARDMIHSAKGTKDKEMKQHKADSLDMQKVQMIERHHRDMDRVIRSGGA